MGTAEAHRAASSPSPADRRRPTRRAAIVGTAAALASLALPGCVSDSGPPAFYRDLASPGAEVDAAAALSLINDYRAKEGRPALVLDDRLTGIAREQAAALAAADEIRLSLSAERALERRLAAAGLSGADAVENTSAGYRTLAEAFSGWRDSAGHNANMLKAEATRFGIGTAYAPASKYRVFWTAIFASEPLRPAPAGPS